MAATLDTIDADLQAIKAQMSNQSTSRSRRFIVELGGSQKITYASSVISPANGLQFNPKFYYNVVVRLSPNAVTTDVNVFIQFVTSQLQTPSKYLLNGTAATKIRLQDVQINNITSDSSLSTATLYVYYTATDAPDRVELDTN